MAETKVKKKQALDGQRLNAFLMDPDDIKIVGLDTGHKKGEHPLWDDRAFLALDPNMVKNFKAVGVRKAILVRKEGDTPYAVDGRQRIKHARQANQELKEAGLEPIMVKVIVERISDEMAFEVMTSTNNVRRDESFWTSLSRLEYYMGLGKTEEQAATIFGVSTATIKARLTLIEAGPEVKAALKKGTLTPTAAVAIAKQPREKQAALVESAATESETGKRATVGEIQRKIRKTEGKGGAHEKPSAYVVRDLVAYLDAASAEGSANLGNNEMFEKGFLSAIKWLRGELAPEKVSNLKHFLRASSEDEEA